LCRRVIRYRSGLRDRSESGFDFADEVGDVCTFSEDSAA
jgi:hypothetical protein